MLCAAHFPSLFTRYIYREYWLVLEVGIQGWFGRGKFGGLCDQLEIGSEWRRRPQQIICSWMEMRLVGLDHSKSRSGMSLPSLYLMPWEEWPLGKFRIPAGIMVWDKVTSGGRELDRADLWSPQEMGAVGRLSQLFCCRVGDETRQLGLGEQREGRIFGVSLSDFWQSWFVVYQRVAPIIRAWNTVKIWGKEVKRG